MAHDDSVSLFATQLFKHYSTPSYFPSKVLVNKRITATGWEQDVRHIELDISGSDIDYNAGDVALVCTYSFWYTLQNRFSVRFAHKTMMLSTKKATLIVLFGTWDGVPMRKWR